MVNYDHVRQGAAMVRFYPTFRIFVIGVPDADVAVKDVLQNDAVTFLNIFRALPLHLIHIQVSDSLAIQEPPVLVCADEAEVPVIYHHISLNFP